MIVTVWIIVDRERGEVCATARPLQKARVGALRTQGCEVYEACIPVPETSGARLLPPAEQYPLVQEDN